MTKKNPTAKVWPHPNPPPYGDEAWHPPGVRTEPHADGRLLHDRNGRLRSTGPQLPDGYLDAPDVAHLPWRREEGQAWTMPELRAVVLTWLVELLDARPWVRGWEIEELRRGLGTPAWPEDQWALRLTLRRTVQNPIQVAFPIPRAARTETPLLFILARVAEAIDAESLL